MRTGYKSFQSLAVKLALAALMLSACAPPTATPNDFPPQPPTATALPPTAVPTPESTSAPANLPVPATSVILGGPSDMVFDSDGNLYVSACGAPRVVKIDPSDELTAYAGIGSSSNPGSASGDGGPALSASISCPGGLAFDHAGNLFIADQYSNQIRRVDRMGIITTVAGVNSDTGDFAGDGGLATAARLCFPRDIAFDADGNLYIADTCNNRIRKIDPQGIITTVAGTGESGFSGDGGPATQATLYGPLALAFDAQNNLYIADGGNARVRKIDRQGIVTTVAGTGQTSFAGDGGPALAAELSIPSGLAFDAEGDLFVADSGGHFNSTDHIRKIDTHGTITTIAGTGVLGLSGDGGPATDADFNQIGALAFDQAGNLYVVDGGNNRVRRIDLNGIITTVVGGAP